VANDNYSVKKLVILDDYEIPDNGVNGMLIEMTKTEFAVFDSLLDDGFEDAEILSELINLFGVEARVVDGVRKVHSKFAVGVAS